MPFLVPQKMQISSKILPQILNFGNFVKINMSVTTASFRHFVSIFVKNEILWSLNICHKDCIPLYLYHYLNPEIKNAAMIA